MTLSGINYTTLTSRPSCTHGDELAWSLQLSRRLKEKSRSSMGPAGPNKLAGGLDVVIADDML